MCTGKSKSCLINQKRGIGKMLVASSDVKTLSSAISIFNFK